MSNQKPKNEKPVAILFIIIGALLLGRWLLNMDLSDSVPLARKFGGLIAPVLLLFAGIGTLTFKKKG